MYPLKHMDMNSILFTYKHYYESNYTDFVAGTKITMKISRFTIGIFYYVFK